MFGNLSFRYKIPLRGAVLMWITATVVSLGLLARAYDDLRTDTREGAESLAAVLGDALVPEITHDDVWRAFNLVSAPVNTARSGSAVQPESVVVFDRLQRVFVSSAPERFPVLATLAEAGPDYVHAIDVLQEAGGTQPRFIEPPGSTYAYLAAPLVSDQTTIATLVLAYPQQRIDARFRRVLFSAGLITTGLVVVMLPFTWFWGSHLADPLVDLAAHMHNAEELPDPATIRDTGDRDELGELTRAFRAMVASLRDKQALEQQIVASDRLAAIGRLAAGIAHEINNPLGGMLNVVNTLQRHGDLDARAQKSLGLIERGLNQIKNTVAALLVEAKISRDPLRPEDLEDMRTLVMAQQFDHPSTLYWANNLTAPVDVPSSQVRQILLNLLLNALQAVHGDGHVWVTIELRQNVLVMEVENDGIAVPPERLPYLFEPFASDRPGGTGLGLWVSYQIVQQMGGAIEVTSGETTRFVVNLPATPATATEENA